MRKPRVIAALVLGSAALALASSPALADRIGPGHKKSWGKSGVSLEQYWIDSAECAHTADATDLEGTDPARALVIASRMIDNQNGVGDVQGALRIAAPEIQWQRAATIMKAHLEACLVDRGYVKFQLTDGQYRMLERHEAGTLERRIYLHSLASDPDVLATQSLNES
jgi:adhesin HecA-like repeat protein